MTAKRKKPTQADYGTIVPAPTSQQKILAKRETIVNGAKRTEYNWFTPEAWSSLPSINQRDKTGALIKAEKQGYKQISPDELAPPERVN